MSTNPSLNEINEILSAMNLVDAAWIEVSLCCDVLRHFVEQMLKARQQQLIVGASNLKQVGSTRKDCFRDNLGRLLSNYATLWSSEPGPTR